MFVRSMAGRVALGLVAGGTLWITGCGGTSSGTDGSTTDALDAGGVDARSDAAADRADVTTTDVGRDASNADGPGDVATADTVSDSGTTDSGTTDSGTTDSGTTDSGTTDSGTTDSGTADAGDDAAMDAADDASAPDVSTVDAVDVSDTGTVTCSAVQHLCGTTCAFNTDPTKCGASCTVCPSGPPSSFPACVNGACAIQCYNDYTATSYGTCEPDFRLLAPMSTSRVTSRRPALHWRNAAGTDGTRVKICSDRTCATVIETRDVTGTSMVPSADLPSGVVYWNAQGLSAGNPVGVPTPTWQFNVGARSALVDTSFGSVLDLNGDGLSDIAVGDWGSQSNAGEVLLHFATSSGYPSTPGIIYHNPVPGSVEYGLGISTAGDVNGDGFSDLAITGNTTLGLVVFFGSAGGVTQDPNQIIPLQNQNGGSVMSLGDVNGDGYADVGVPTFDSSGTVASGRAYVLYGGGQGLSTSHMLTLRNPDATDTDHVFGSSIGSAGDVDGDGYNDILVGASGRTGQIHGLAYLYRGSAAGIATTPDLTFLQPDGTLVTFGDHLVCAGDVNGDGYSDFLLANHQFGAGGATNGEVFVYLGGATGPSTTPSITIPAQSLGGYFFAEQLAGNVDINGDGYSDILVETTPQNTSMAGAVFIYFGSPTGPSTTPSVTLTSSTDPSFGGSVAGVGDSNHDGFDEVLVGAFGTPGAGKAYLFRGAATGVASGNTVLSDGPGDNYYYGYSVTNVR